METYSFKRGPVRQTETWTVYPSRIEGSGKRVSFRDVKQAHFAYMPARVTVAQLILKSETETIKLQCNSRRGTESHQAFAGLVEAVLVNLRYDNPDLKFTPPPGNQLAMRIGQVSGLIPAGFGLNFIYMGVRDGSGFGIGMGVFFILLGAFMAFMFSPGNPTPKTIEETMQHVRHVYTL